MSPSASESGGFDVVGVGECSIDDVWVVEDGLELGKKGRAGRSVRMGGGQIATAMVAAGRLGLRSAFIGAVGDDADGALVTEGLRDEGVDTAGVRVVKKGATRRALILVVRGDRTVIEHRDSNVRIDPLSLDLEAIKKARVVHLDSTDLGASLLVARAAKSAGVKISVDVDQPVARIDELLALADLCFLSEGIPERLTEESSLRPALLSLAKRTSGLLGVTLGDRGAAALDGEHLVLSPAFDTDVVDTTACGDTFHAAAIVAMLEGQPVPELLRFANAAASLKCRALGRSGCPRREEVDALLRRA